MRDGDLVGPSCLGVVMLYKEVVVTISLFGSVFLLFGHSAAYSPQQPDDIFRKYFAGGGAAGCWTKSFFEGSIIGLGVCFSTIAPLYGQIREKRVQDSSFGRDVLASFLSEHLSCFSVRPVGWIDVAILRTFMSCAVVMCMTLSKYGTILWGPELLGCFPSVSGIKTTDEVTTRSSMQEVMDWLEVNPMEFVVVYMDTGSDISRLDKFDELNALLTDVFGDLIVPQSVLKSLASDSWAGGSVNEFLSAGYRVLLLANDDTGLAYSLYDFCGGHKVLSTTYIDTLADNSRKIDGLEIYGDDYFLRSYQSELRYISLSDEGELTEDFETFLNSSNIGNFVRWDMNLVATDMVDGAKMSAEVWSWAENEPSTTASGAYVLMNTSGRWVASTTTTKTYKACWSSSSLAWSIVAYANSCASSYTYSAPADPYQNYLLKTAMSIKGITTTSIVINATLS